MWSFRMKITCCIPAKGNSQLEKEKSKMHGNYEFAEYKQDYLFYATVFLQLVF